MRVVELQQLQVQKLTQQQLQSVELLQLSTVELEAYIQELALENPMVEPEERTAAELDRGEELISRLRWLEDNDRQNHFYQTMSEEELDPLARIGTEGGLEETLQRFVLRQIDRLPLDRDMTRCVQSLACFLEDDGYLRVGLEEISKNTRIPVPMLEQGLEILQSLDPPGVGAETLSQCLVLQLERQGEVGPALSVAKDCLDLLAKRRYRAIGEKLGLTMTQVQQAEERIQQLEPRPGMMFQRSEQVAYIQPDVFVEESDGGYVIQVRQRERPMFHINSYYRELLKQSSDREVREYLGAKLRQAENVLWAVDQRESTLQRCAQVIVQRQNEFFRRGPMALVPLRLVDVAQELGIHESTVSRAVREKYLQCQRGVYPLNYFFSRRAVGEEQASSMGATAARMLLRRLIEEEDKAAPLSDQKLCERMAQEGCPLSRRTVAKYRDEMNIPGASGRRRY
ncbi:RNA polymerase sigma-54 factor [Pseudoflavonifractor sp. AF19-9AC]|nr:RNA polymerase sigma-54 factor [Pseudoflavonifractor sp. AF19-9AC]